MTKQLLATLLFAQHFIQSASYMNQVISPYYNNKMHSQSLQKSPSSAGIFQSIDQREENHDRTMKRFYTSCPLFSFEPNISSDASVSSTSSIPSIAASDISVEFSLGPVELESLESRFMKSSLPSPHGQSNQFSLLTHLVRSWHRSWHVVSSSKSSVFVRCTQLPLDLQLRLNYLRSGI